MFAPNRSQLGCLFFMILSNDALPVPRSYAKKAQF
jgi:hypothetical protein